MSLQIRGKNVKLIEFIYIGVRGMGCISCQCSQLPGTGQIRTALTAVLWRRRSPSSPSCFSPPARVYQNELNILEQDYMYTVIKSNVLLLLAEDRSCSFDVSLISLVALIRQSNRVSYRGHRRDEGFLFYCFQGW